MPVGCEVRPGTVVRQRPDPGTVLAAREEVVVWVASMDLKGFRGPCEPTDGDLGPVRGSDAKLARQFYRFTADPALDGPFTSGAVWVGIEAGPTSHWVSESARPNLEAWHLPAYAERSGPLSALDVVAASGGFYRLHRGVQSGCTSTDQTPPELAGLRVLSLTAPPDVTQACMDWWGVSLFLNEADEIKGVSLRLGSP